LGSGFGIFFSIELFIYSKAVHGEHYLEIMNSIPSSGTLYSEPKIIDVLDKGSGALFIIGGNSENPFNQTNT
jgi:hypothetical protein